MHYTELGHKLRGRPEKRVGGGGYGNNRNRDPADKTRHFKQISHKSQKNFAR